MNEVDIDILDYAKVEARNKICGSMCPCRFVKDKGLCDECRVLIELINYYYELYKYDTIRELEK